MDGFHQFKVDLTHEQGRKVLKGKPIRLAHHQIGKGKAHYFHLENAQRLHKAHRNGKGTVLHMSHGEVLRTHQSNLPGSGFWGNVWDGVKSAANGVGNFLKNNWKPIVGGVADGVAAAVPELQPVRDIAKSITGVGVPRKRMTKKNIKGGSFMLN